MHPALWVSKTGLDAQQTNISTISNNLANASTVGFKKGRAVFEDLFYQNINQPGAQATQDSTLPTGLMLGAGSKVVATQKVFTQGNTQTTNNAMDMMIEGDGFFQILLPDGNMAYTRNGQFTINADGQLVTTGSGYVVQPEIVVPKDAVGITVGTDGEVSARIRGQQENQVLGQLTTVDFINPGGLEPIGQNLFLPTGASGDAQEGTPGLDGLGTIRQSTLETSNVNVTEELVNMIEAQRVYEMNSKVISTVDQMLSYVNQQL
ncbi:Flagellar basal-body rod protein FlgG [Photobacterium damselae subsp. piscicida]|uniref:Flagellar basal-body rod protein FlgG n=1 Tax=Photobacterium damsela subsp. piscicida TaxID=38294 RepID=A0A1V1V9P7_PHODP|nr:flagellar basal-body rod protein FlgG [Photobacterium damselae]MBE8129818.1 flagellar basal-body rod protein FlgG [Photobacterium damselae subsp. piscicida]MDP2516074.1 flagellar basal-body rod protein FlgG [Photobacterium damselae subsp. piscicida]MDP2533231.1 flagellar basal-body rod protein FlgG [Photobacterium damselae subsp. piscicida]MDP2545456.1 flagellar basal-body rod protein FlgG [Photobacterium damselae subsp. piscicida]MDP2570069.1 flagellar basal-body rod protein FlgG [Photobac